MAMNREINDDTCTIPQAAMALSLAVDAGDNVAVASLRQRLTAYCEADYGVEMRSGRAVTLTSYEPSNHNCAAAWAAWGYDSDGNRWHMTYADDQGEHLLDARAI